MTNIEITNNDINGVVVFNPLYQTVTVTATGAETWPAGAVLGRITTGSKVARYASVNIDGTEVPKFVLTQEVIFDGAGDKKCQVLISGQVRASFLVDATDTALTIPEIDELRDFTIIGRDAEQLAELDNQ